MIMLKINMINVAKVNLHVKFAVLWIIIQVVSLYQHNIYVSEKLRIIKCQQINNTTYQCSSITEVFQQLSNCCNSTDITIKPGNYNLAISHELADLHDIRIRSETDQAIIQCAANVNGTYDFDTGIAFVRVRNLVITNINIVGCGMKHNSTNHDRAGKFIIVRSALYIQNSTNIILDSVAISGSNGIGLLIYDTNGTVNITKSLFIKNILNSLEQSKLFTGGGGIYIELTQCTPGMVVCNHTSNHFNQLTKYTIDNCTFKDNTATYHLNGSEPEDLANGVFITFGTGGGISLWLSGNAQNNSFKVTSTTFTSNSARYGGGININSKQDTKYNNVQISQCCFVANFGNSGGGGLTFGYTIYQSGGQSLFNTYIIANCLFEQNQGRLGGGVTGFGSREPNRSHPTNHFKIYNSSFINNGAQYGSAIEINKEFYDSILVGTVLTLVLNNCTFLNNNLHKINSSSNSSSVGAVALSGANVEFRETTIFSNNNSTALIVDGASARFSNNSMTIFQDNSGLHGGAISLISGAWITVHPNSSVIFLRNTAIQYGGAIYVGLSRPFDYLLSHICFVKYYIETVPPSEWETNFTFANNTAKSKMGNVIFARTFIPCVKAYNDGIDFLRNKPFHYLYETNHPVFSSSPATFKFLNQNRTTFSTVPGETFDMPVQLIDELGQHVNSAMFIATCNGPPSPYVVPLYQYTNGSVKIAGKPNEICQLQMKTDAEYPVSTTVQVVLLNCPPGFVYSNEKAECKCMVDHDHQNPAISDCDLTLYQAYFNQFYWIGYESDNAEELLISPCPYGYCYEDHISEKDQLLPRDVNKTTLDLFVCGNRSRTGLLCGECIEGYSVALNSPAFTCYKCENLHLGILYLLLSYIIPVSILFYIIMAYNIRMTTGPIGAFLFFSQIISSQNYFTMKTNSDETLFTSSIVLTTYSITNLQFFQHDAFSYCLFPSAGTVDILAFNLILSFYPILLVFIYFLLRHYCTCRLQCLKRSRISTKSVTHGICAFLILCFAKVNVLAFGILRSADISYINETSFRKVVYLQGSLTYFRDPLYDAYAIGSLFTIVTVISIPTLILLFHPIMIEVVRYFQWGETKCVIFINKLLFIHTLKPVLDSFQGDYKDNLRFFAGLHSFLYRIIFFCIIIAASTPDINSLLLLIIAYFVIILLIHMLVMPFKRYIDNASYTLIYIIMLIIVIIELYLFSTGESSVGLVIWLEIILSLLPIILIVLYCLWKLGVPLWRKHHHNYDESYLDDNDLLHFPDRMYNDDNNM